MSVPVVTLHEAIDVISRLDARPVSYWCVYRALRQLAFDALIPQHHARGAVLLTPAEVFLCRLWNRLVDTGIRPSVAGAVIANNRVALLSACRGSVLVVRGVRGSVVSATEAAGLPGLRFPLDGCADGVLEAVRQVRAAEPCVWSGARYERPHDVQVMLSSQVAVTV